MYYGTRDNLNPMMAKRGPKETQVKHKQNQETGKF